MCVFFLFRDVENQNTKCDFEPLLTSNIVIRKSHKLSHSDYHAGATILQSIEEEVSCESLAFDHLCFNRRSLGGQDIHTLFSFASGPSRSSFACLCFTAHFPALFVFTQGKLLNELFYPYINKPHISIL